MNPDILIFLITYSFTNIPITQSFKPPGILPVIPPVELPGGTCVHSIHYQSRGHRALCFDPGDLPCLTEAVRSANSFSGVKTARKSDRLAQTPDRQANVAASLHMAGSS